MKTFKIFDITYQTLFKLAFIITSVLIFICLSNRKSMGQQHQMVRLAKIKVDASQLEKYNFALNKQMKTAIRLDPGVLIYYAVADKTDPTNITTLEIYADTTAYKSHIETTHFKKYKETVKDMVKSLELVDVSLIGVAKKPNR